MSAKQEQSSKPIYCDYAATTPVDPRVAAVMMDCLTINGTFGNPASRDHLYGWLAEEAVESARQQVADLLHCDPREVVWTSGATESDNLALKGVAHFYRSKGRHIITSKIEHKAVLDSCRQLEQEGFEVTYLEPNSAGIIEPTQVEAALRENTILVSLMHVNNELGTITDIASIAQITRASDILFHVDAAQSVGKVPVDLSVAQVDLMSLSAHKIYGPKGVGALFVRRTPRARLEAQIHGGGHERGMRSGTLPTHQLVGFGMACQIAQQEMAEESKRLWQLRHRFWQVVNELEAVYLNGDPDVGIAGIINISFAYVDGEALMMALKDLAVSSGSACASASLDPSYVLKGIGLEDELAHSSIRFSFGRFTTEEEIDRAAQSVKRAVAALREHSPAWQQAQTNLIEE